jgi:hypothetical protein
MVFMCQIWHEKKIRVMFVHLYTCLYRASNVVEHYVSTLIQIPFPEQAAKKFIVCLGDWQP